MYLHPLYTDPSISHAAAVTRQPPSLCSCSRATKPNHGPPAHCEPYVITAL